VRKARIVSEVKSTFDGKASEQWETLYLGDKHMQCRQCPHVQATLQSHWYKPQEKIELDPSAIFRTGPRSQTMILRVERIYILIRSSAR
jgi:hypothetical protein